MEPTWMVPKNHGPHQTTPDKALDVELDALPKGSSCHNLQEGEEQHLPRI